MKFNIADQTISQIQCLSIILQLHTAEPSISPPPPPWRICVHSKACFSSAIESRILTELRVFSILASAEITLPFNLHQL